MKGHMSGPIEVEPGGHFGKAEGNIVAEGLVEVGDEAVGMFDFASDRAYNLDDFLVDLRLLVALFLLDFGLELEFFPLGCALLASAAGFLPRRVVEARGFGFFFEAPSVWPLDELFKLDTWERSDCNSRCKVLVSSWVCFRIKA